MCLTAPGRPPRLATTRHLRATERRSSKNTVLAAQAPSFWTSMPEHWQQLRSSKSEQAQDVQIKNSSFHGSAAVIGRAEWLLTKESEVQG